MSSAGAGCRFRRGGRRSLSHIEHSQDTALHFRVMNTNRSAADLPAIDDQVKVLPPDLRWAEGGGEQQVRAMKSQARKTAPVGEGAARGERNRGCAHLQWRGLEVVNVVGMRRRKRVMRGLVSSCR